MASMRIKKQVTMGAFYINMKTTKDRNESAVLHTFLLQTQFIIFSSDKLEIHSKTLFKLEEPLWLPSFTMMSSDKG